MGSHFGDQKVEFKCQGCGYVFKETIQSLATNPILECPKCKATTQVEADNLAATTREADKAIGDLQKTVDRLNQEIKLEF